MGKENDFTGTKGRYNFKIHILDMCNLFCNKIRPNFASECPKKKITSVKEYKRNYSENKKFI